MNRISDRIEALRRFMHTKDISAFIVPSTDLILENMYQLIGSLGNGFPDSPVRPVQL